MRSLMRIAAATAALSAAATITGCASSDGSGERTGYTAQSLYPEKYYSIAVPIFDNRTYYTGVEREITDALIKEIQKRTPYAVVNNNDAAETELSGTITGVEKTRLNRSRGSGLVREMLLSVTVDFQWRDVRTGKMIVQRQNFSVGDEYMPSRPVGETPEIAEFGVSQRLAEQIVAAMRDQW